MKIRSIDDPKHWHDRAAEMRILPDKFADSEAKSGVPPSS
jgi:hypothetical protein